MRRAVLGTVLLAASAVTAPARANPNVVVAVSSLYEPGEVVIVQGTGLTFANLDADFHDVTADAGEFHSATIARGTAKVVGVEDLEPNTYSYYCTVHEGMFGLLTVVQGPSGSKL